MPADRDEAIAEVEVVAAAAVFSERTAAFGVALAHGRAGENYWGIDINMAVENDEFRIAQRTYKAIGFRNNSGGYELRNSWFKGSSSPKDVTLIRTGSTQVFGSAA